MGGWREGGRVCRHRFLSQSFDAVALIFIAICMSVPKSYAKEGFLSIDCGYAGPDYTENNLTWTADYGKYINTGDSYEQPPLNLNATYISDAWSTFGSYYPNDGSSLRSLQSLRFFREPRNKYCYELPTLGSSYLIRASFYMNETTLNENGPFQFILFLDSNNWFTLTSGDGSLPYLLAIVEAVFHPPNNVTNFCLQPVRNVPFISSLELRQLENTMYSYSGSDNEYLALQFRYNLVSSGSNTTSSVRFPDDQFDRIWATWDIGVNDSLSTPPFNTTSGDFYYVPPKVMQDGWALYTGITSVFSVYSNYLPVYVTPAERMFAVVYAGNLDSINSQVYFVNVTMDANSYQVNFSNHAGMQATPNFVLSSNAIQFGFEEPADSYLGMDSWPTLNAVEVYGQYNYNLSTTLQSDVDAITHLKRSINMTSWQGDPCIPVPHDWLSCSVVDLRQLYFSQDIFILPVGYHPAEQPCDSGDLNSSKYCPQDQWFSHLTFFISALSLSNLTSEGLNFFTRANTSESILFSRLQTLIITNSGIDEAILELILKNFVSTTDLSILDLTYNSLERIPRNWFYALHATSINLSHNNISGEMSTFDEALSLKKLDLSYNSMNHSPSNWTYIVNTKSLVFLDLSHNQFQGEISSLDNLVLTNKESLQELNVSNNNLQGIFSSSTYFAGLPNLITGTFDQNSIQGILNLSTWYEALQMAAYGNSNTSVVTNQLFSFVNNSILDITPDAKTIESTMDILMEKYPSFHQYGIFLGGNPYCKNAKSYIPKYVCRYSSTDKTQKDYEGNNYTALIVGICGGVVALLLSGVTSATLWKLSKQVHALRAVEKALADRKVQPPFFHYNDLKLATKDFHKDQKLGQGGFGIVYKGVLVDGTKLAVKRLHNSQRLQIVHDLDEFLNEVVLITGIKHRNLVQLKGCCIKDNQRLLAYEYVEKGNLAQALWGSKPHGGLNWEQRFNVCVGVARGLAYLHEELQPSIMHRDVKPANILLDSNFKPKIADFGLARYFANEGSRAHFTANIAGTLGYFSPEYASQGQLSAKADVYSYGIVILEIVSGRKCIDHSLPCEEVYLKDWAHDMHNKGVLFGVLELQLRDQCVVAEVIRALIIGLLCVQNSPESRPTMSEVVTKFLGHTDIKIDMDKFQNAGDHDLKGLSASTTNDLEHPDLPIIQEDSADLFSLDPNHQFPFSVVDGRLSSKPQIELTDIQVNSMFNVVDEAISSSRPHSCRPNSPSGEV